MKISRVVLSLAILASTTAFAAADGVKFDVVLLKEGAIVAKPSAIAEFGHPVILELGQLMKVIAVADAPGDDGRSETSVKPYLFTDGQMKPVQEMSMRAQLKATPSFEYTVPGTTTKFIVMPRRVALPGRS